jgi:uncharacterized protein YodC (DUF2158 family)
MFKLGEQVRLKSGGPIMTVDEISGSQVWCSWFDDKRPQTSFFELSSLVSAAMPHATKASGPSVFISHSSKDEDLAGAVVELLRSALNLTSNDIRCTTLDGYRLPIGVHTESTLREEVNAAKVLVALVTPNSLSSPFVLFEVGARWGAGSFIAPLLVGITAEQVPAPLSYVNSLHARGVGQLHQFVEDMANSLGKTIQNPSSYNKHIVTLNQLASTVHNLPNAEIAKESEIVGPMPPFGYVFNRHHPDDPLCPVCFQSSDSRLAFMGPLHSWSGGMRRECPMCGFLMYEVQPDGPGISRAVQRRPHTPPR